MDSPQPCRFGQWKLYQRLESSVIKKLDKGFKDGPRCINWMGAAKVSYNEIIRLESIFTKESRCIACWSEVELPHADLSCDASRLVHVCVAVSGLDWMKPNYPMMCVDHGVRLGDTQFSSGGVTFSTWLVT
ncbi:hypothetical protein Bca4012_066049 [Brassica carinata]